MKFLALALAASAMAAPVLVQPAYAQEQAAAPAAGPQGTGFVQSVDAKAGTVTIHHGPISTLGWPAMTMTFKASPEVVKAAKPGAKVTFTLTAAGDQVVALR
jgi:Cu(I)/Ag(I) efflux system protein CusF